MTSRAENIWNGEHGPHSMSFLLMLIFCVVALSRWMSVCCTMGLVFLRLFFNRNLGVHIRFGCIRWSSWPGFGSWKIDNCRDLLLLCGVSSL